MLMRIKIVYIIIYWFWESIESILAKYLMSVKGVVRLFAIDEIFLDASVVRKIDVEKFCIIREDGIVVKLGLVVVCISFTELLLIWVKNVRSSLLVLKTYKNLISINRNHN